MPRDLRRRSAAATHRPTETVVLQADTPAIYLIEDAHWIDEASESVLADLMSGMPQASSSMVVTYRPEYVGALTQSPHFQQITLDPLTGTETSDLASELLGPDPSVAELASRIVERSAGNPFYVQEIVREYVERQVLVGERGSYRRQQEISDVSVPPTLQATIGARIDRLSATAKRTLYAAAVIGTRFDDELVAIVLDDAEGAAQAALPELVHSELIDQVMFTPRAEYAFRHPLVQSVAYESQLKPARAQLHRRLAMALQHCDSSPVDDRAALIATHLEAAGEIRDSFSWHMRAGAWLTNRDINTARNSWQRARDLADRLSADEPDRTSMRIAPRALLCGSSWRAGDSVTEADVEELQALCVTPASRLSLAMGMSGHLMDRAIHGRVSDAAQLATEYVHLVESIGDPTVTVGLLYPAIYAKHEAGHMTEVLDLARRVIDLADGDPTKGNLLTGSPLAFATMMRASAKCALGQRGWKTDFDQAITIAEVDQTTWVSMIMFKYVLAIPLGALLADTRARDDTAKALETAERCSEDFAVDSAQLARGVTLVAATGADDGLGYELLAEARAAAVAGRFMSTTVPVIDMLVAAGKARAGDLDAAIDISRTVIDRKFDSGATQYLGAAASVLVESLARRSRRADVDEAQAIVDRLSAAPTDPGFVLYKLPLLQMAARLAQARGDQSGYQRNVGDYERMALKLGFDGHAAAAAAMK